MFTEYRNQVICKETERKLSFYYSIVIQQHQHLSVIVQEPPPILSHLIRSGYCLHHLEGVTARNAKHLSFLFHYLLKKISCLFGFVFCETASHVAQVVFKVLT